MSLFQIIMYVLAFVIVGIPLVGFITRSFVRVGKIIYQEFPFVKKFFDEYFEHFGLGSLIVGLGVVVYLVLHWIGIF